MKPKTVVHWYTIDPTKGAIALFAGCALDGHRLVSIERKHTRVKVTYLKLS